MRNAISATSSCTSSLGRDLVRRGRSLGTFEEALSSSLGEDLSGRARRPRTPERRDRRRPGRRRRDTPPSSSPAPAPRRHTHLDPGVPDGAPPHVVQRLALVVLRRVDDARVPREDALVPVDVHADGQGGDLPGREGGRPVLDQVGHRRGEARGEAPGGHHRDVHGLRRHGGGGWVEGGRKGEGGGASPWK